MLAKHDQHILWLAILLENHSVALALSQKRNVGADGITLRQRRSYNAQNRTHHNGELEAEAHGDFPFVV
jgi:hypothetical protein